ncbi:SRPBCC family protein [Rhodococcus sp. X156]|uniref:SRPBCC family protein n=1 Tax=Rhodococcus sp. X156 TaxID=2499145 RepID=UPI000FD993BF|nr:SRPBCC family protein [Rhodococcus sp. X156]
MKLENVITVPAPPEQVFALINDVERVASCVPGATLTGKDGDAYVGGVKVKVGPVSAAYNGKIRFLSVDDATRRLTMEGKGADSHGNGDAQAHIALAVDPVEGGSQLRVDTDLVISGKIVAFGKGAIVAVSNKIMAQFATNLAAMLQGDAAGSDASAVAPVAGAPVAAVAQGAPVAAAAPVSGGELNALSMLPPEALKVARIAGIFVAGMFEGWLVSRAFGKRR